MSQYMTKDFLTIISCRSIHSRPIRFDISSFNILAVHGIFSILVDMLPHLVLSMLLLILSLLFILLFYVASSASSALSKFNITSIVTHRIVKIYIAKHLGLFEIHGSSEANNLFEVANELLVDNSSLLIT